MSRWVLVVFLIITGLLQACAVQTINEVASTLYLKPQAEISRQRHVTISHLSHIGFYIDNDHVLNNPEYAEDPLLKPRLSELYEGAAQAFISTFAGYTGMDKPRSVVRSMDFIVHAQLIDMTLTEETLVEPPNPDLADETLNEQEQIEVSTPTDYLKLKLVLKDARSQKLIDVAYLQARSGHLDYRKGYAAFAEHSMRQYLKAITQ